MKKKWVLILIAIAFLAIGGAVGYFVSRAGNDTAPITTNKPTPAEVIEITAEKLAKELMANPDKYKEGTVMQVSGPLARIENSLLTIFFLTPLYTPSNSGPDVVIVFDQARREDQELYQALKLLNDGDQVIIRGVYSSPAIKEGGGVYLKKASLVSVTPAQPTAPIPVTPPVQPPPVVTNPKASTPTSGAIEITAKKLITDVQNDPYKYNPGTIFRVSGIVERVVSLAGSGYMLYIGPKVKENIILVQFFRTSLGADEEKQFSALEKLRGGEQIVIQGSYIGVMGEFVSLQNPLIVSIK